MMIQQSQRHWEPGIRMLLSRFDWGLDFPCSSNHGSVRNGRLPAYGVDQGS